MFWIRVNFFTDLDPDPEVEAGDQYGSGSIRIQGFNDQKFNKKITAEKKYKIFLGSKTAINLSLASIKYVQVTEEACSSQKRPSNTSKHEFFLLLWVIFTLLDPDPVAECGSGSTGPIEYGSNTNTDPDPDPDPKPCFFKGKRCR